MSFNRRQTLQTGAAVAAFIGLGGERVAFAQSGDPAPDALKLWYRAPAEEWIQALPIGNGRLGAMVFGGVARERLQLNEDTLWAGGPYDPSSADARAALPEVRRLIFEGRYAEAQTLANERMMGRPIKQMSYQTIGDLMLSFDVSAFASGYRRELDLDSATVTTRYEQDGVTFVREAFVSAIDQVIVMRVSADRPGALNFKARFETPQQADASIDNGCLVLRGVNTSQQGIAAQLRFETRVKVLPTGGDAAGEGGEISVSGADSALILIAAATNFKSFNDVSGDEIAETRAHIAAASAKSFDQLRNAHLAAHRELFRRVSIDLGATPAGARPTDERIRGAVMSNDPSLAALYFQYARYLLISCSRAGTQPANLQGLWNHHLTAPWESKYTININTEMNYWPAEPTNLAECVEPLVRMVKEIAVTGARTAEVNYGARGWMAHHNTDLWRATAAIDGAFWGMWPTGGAWLCKHLWDHYDYGRDRAFLEDVYPVLKGAALFFINTLVEDPRSGHLVTCPSISPENAHPHGGSICAGPAMDSQILRDLFANVIAASEILRVDAPLRAELAAARARLPEDRIGKAGQLQEWMEDWDMEAPEPDHRHVSHLYALYPSEQISTRRTPALAAAAKRSLELRGDFSTGWAIAWRINLWARLHEGERTHTILKALLGPDRTYPNMFDAHPPFQIDGNFGGANGIAEMLLQCVDGEIELLPALPSAWPNGSVRGLRARGGFELDIAWAEGALTTARLRGAPGGQAVVRYGDAVRRVRVAAGRAATLRWTGRALR